MPPGADNTVSIQVQVVDANSGAVLTGLEKKLQSVGAAGAAAGTRLGEATAGATSFGAAAADSGERAAAGAARAAVAHSNLRAQIGLLDNTIRGAHGMAMADLVRLTARTGIVMQALPFAAAAAGFIFVGSAVYDLTDKLLNTHKALDAYTQKAAEAADQKLFDNASVEETIALLGEVNSQIDELKQKRQNYAVYDITGVENLNGESGASPFTAADDAAQAKAQENLDKLTEHQRQQNQQIAQERLKGQTEYDSAVTQGYAHITAHEKDTIAEANQRYKFMAEQEANLVKIHNDGVKAMSASELAAARAKGGDVTIHAADPQAFEQQRQAAITAAQQQASGERIALAITTNEELIKLDDEARNAKLAGISLLRAQESEAVDEVTRKYQQQGQSRQAIDRAVAGTRAKYDADVQKALDEQAAKLEQMRHEAESAGLTGIAKVQSDGAYQLAQINSPAAQRDQSPEAVAARAQESVYAQQKTNADILAEQRQFGEEMGAIAEHNADQVTSGYAKIDAETQRSLTHVEQEWEKTYGGIDQSSAIALAGLQAREAAFAKVFENEAREKQKYSQDADRQIATTEAEAARALLPPWQAAQQKIVDDYAERVQKIRDQENQELASVRENTAERKLIEQQANRQIVAAYTLAQAEMQKQTEQARDQIAGQLESFFDNPAKYMEQRAKKVMFDIMANWLEQVSETNPKLQGMLGGIFGLNKVGTGSPANALGTLFGTNHPAAATHELAGAPQLSVAGNTLQAAGVNLNAAARALLAASGTAHGPAGVGRGGVGSGGISSTSSAGFPAELGVPGSSTPVGLYSGESLGLPTGTSELGGSNIGIVSAATAALGIAGGTGAGAGTAGQITGGVEEAVQVGGLLKRAYSSTSAPGSVFSGGGASYGLTAGPGSDESIAPGEHTVADEESPGYDDAGGTLDDGNSIDAGSGVSGGPGLVGGGLTAITGGLALFGEAESAFNAPSVSSGLLAAGEMGLTGAEIGLTFGGPLGAGIGAAAGFAAGLVTDLFGDHGASRMRQYNVITVIPGLQQALDGFSAGGGSYDSATQAINQIELQAQKSAKSWGTGAMGVYTGTIVPEIDTAEAQIAREGGAGRSLVKFGVAQFHAGGVIDDFGSLWTSPTTGFIHAQLGEHITDNMTTAQAMQRSTADLSSLMRGPARGMGANGSDGGSPVHIHLHTIDGESTERWLRNGGGAIIQTHLNQRAAKYAGKAVNNY